MSADVAAIENDMQDCEESLTYDQLTMTQQQCLKACHAGGALVGTTRGFFGVSEAGNLLLPAFPRRMINTLQRNGFIEPMERVCETRFQLTRAGNKVVEAATC